MGDHRNVLNQTNCQLDLLSVSFEQLDLKEANIDAILFIRHSKRLKTIKIDRMFDTNLNLFALNREREKLENECKFELFALGKVSIDVPEEVYLATKWKSQNSNLKLVKIKRSDPFNYYDDY